MTVSAKDTKTNRAAATGEDSYSNLVRPHKSLRLAVSDTPGLPQQPKAPAMTAKLADDIWTVKELLTTLPLPRVNDTSWRDYPNLGLGAIRVSKGTLQNP